MSAFHIGLRPFLQRSLACFCERINAAGGALKPAIDIAMQDFRRIGDHRLQIPRALKAKVDLGGAG